MKIRRKLGSIVSASVAILMGTAAQAGERPFMPLGDAVAPPPGFADLCQRGEVACEPLEPSLAQAALTPTAAVLATSSIGYSWPERVAAAAAAAAEDAKPDPTVALAQFTALDAYRPTIAADFVPAGGWSWTSAEQAAPPPAQIAEAAPAPAPAIMTAPLLRSAQMKMVNTINREVNRDVHKATDFDLYGLLEYWSLPRVIDGKMYGDCEDYALEKRRRLIAAGVPAQALSMAVAVTARGESHAVLVVSFESGDWVLDNLTPWATPWEELNYRWVQRQVAGSSNWTTVG
ncbi:putative periplasmic protein [Caulobacter sp. AP07]|uniref:transglutaminase-like cysteine peptidase n=1 Tax=Caulobacter sp. AP07 TaxID=1144304 RepID=UPI000271ED9B|nr:transglutaminase-like cysteine peptidase [Caulobacter sp. AP07]EJL34048.1 putative periplasmic protein [Caulobacter sp. AP07]